MEKKTYSRSIRMTETVRQYVEQQTGNGFNEKFEKMVMFCMTGEENLRKRIKTHEQTLANLDKQINKKRQLLNTLERLELRLSDVDRNLSMVFTELNAIVNK